MVSPPPCGCGAPADAPCSFPPAVAYPPPPYPGGYYHPSPFPDNFSSYPAPASGYFPAPGYGSPSFPAAAAAYHHSFPFLTSPPAAFPAEIHTHIGPNWSPASPTPIHGDLHHHQQCSPATHDHLPVQAAPQPNAAPTTPSRESLPAQSRHTPDSRPPRSKTSRALGTGEKGASKSGSVLQPATPDCQGGSLTKSNSAGGVSVADEKFVCEHSGPGIFSMPNAGLDHRLDTHQGQFQSSLESLLGELSKLSTLVSQFTVAMDRRTTEAPITESSGCTGFSSAPSMFSASVAPQVLDEMPTPQSGYENCYGYPNQIQSSCVQGGSTNLSEQYLDELPHYYGFENLKRQSVFLADGTERSFYALPEEYPLKQATLPMSPSARKNVGVTSSPSVTCLVPGICSKENKTTGESLLIHVAQPPTSVQDYPCGLKEMHVSDVSDEETQNTEELLKCVVKAPETEQTIAYLNYLTDVQQQHSVEKASVHVQQLRDPQWNVLVTPERRKEWDPGEHTCRSSTHKRDIVGVLQTSISTLETINHPTECNSMKYLFQSVEIKDPGITRYFFILRYSNMKCNSWLITVVQSMADPGVLVMHSGVTHNSTRTNPEWLKISSSTSRELSQSPSVKCSTNYTWDPADLYIIDDKMLDKYVVAYQVRSVQQTTELLFFSLTDCKQYIAPNGLYSVLHVTSILQGATHSSQDYLCFFYCNGVLKTVYCPMRYVCEFLVGLATRLKWDPGVPEILHSYTATHPIVTHPGAFTHVLQCIFASATECCYIFCLVWAEVNGSALFVLVVPCFACTFVAMHFLFLSNGDSSRTRHPKLFMQSLCATKAVQVTQQIHPLEFLLMREVLQNMSDFSDGQVAYMPQSSTINSTEFLRHMFTVLSRWLSSLENSVKLQWDPGIAFVYQQGVQKNCNANNMPPSENYLQIWEIDIVFITFLPP